MNTEILKNQQFPLKYLLLRKLFKASIQTKAIEIPIKINLEFLCNEIIYVYSGLPNTRHFYSNIQKCFFFAITFSILCLIYIIGRLVMLKTFYKFKMTKSDVISSRESLNVNTRIKIKNIKKNI